MIAVKTVRVLRRSVVTVVSNLIYIANIITLTQTTISVESSLFRTWNVSSISSVRRVVGLLLYINIMYYFCW